ncbi:recombination protein RecT [Lactobacillus plantarum subsp. plantarum ST-III] [Lactiplantibacillus mudanjiangensis]|uniref:recombinase RecT n=1 Tax=Lactiplantibacillus mudanjiangensis TaxID=1296538 RepID=UPI00101565ED|nr:RecT family recombinase [Lactiplantibacillus mudanjiangensis]VDG33351.1 recombination protein RecT [Lactobacillus plantarum subsp. plantarum ST-III] [Lactiplantibacillus mudanjiangensis]
MSNQLVTTVNENIMDMKQNEGLSLPPDYSVGNALNSAYLILSDTSKGKPLLERCDQGSVIKALMNMAIQGLSPAKNQCYFIPYGTQLVMQRSYFGSISVVKRLSNVKDIQAQIVHKDDVFEIGGVDGMLVVKKFEPSFENLDKPIIGAFAWVEDNDGNRTYTVMTKKDIDMSWSHAKTKNVQNEFPEEMAKRTIINRAAKFFINSSSDNDLFVQAVNNTTNDEYEDDPKDVTPPKRSLMADVGEQQGQVAAEPDITDEAPIEPNNEEATLNDEDAGADGQTELFTNLDDVDAE